MGKPVSSEAPSAGVAKALVALLEQLDGSSNFPRRTAGHRRPQRHSSVAAEATGRVESRLMIEFGVSVGVARTIRLVDVDSDDFDEG